MKNLASPQLALLIDADNLSPNEVANVFKYLTLKGYQLPIRRAYGGLEKLTGMKDVLREHAVRALVNQGKGTTDVSLTIDAMDLLHSLHLPATVAIVSSDADFAPLALRLRESGHRVLCFANHLNSNPHALAIAYDEVVFVDDLTQMDGNVTASSSKDKSANRLIPHQVVKDAVDSKAEKLDSQAAQSPQLSVKHPALAQPKPSLEMPTKGASKAAAAQTDDPAAVKLILEVLPGWLANTVKNLNQIGSPLRASGIAKGSKPLHELFRKHPSYFKVVPTTGPAKQIKLLKLPV